MKFTNYKVVGWDSANAKSDHVLLLCLRDNIVPVELDINLRNPQHVQMLRNVAAESGIDGSHECAVIVILNELQGKTIKLPEAEIERKTG